jgi:hypothetical protein
VSLNGWENCKEFRKVIYMGAYKYKPGERVERLVKSNKIDNTHTAPLAGPTVERAKGFVKSVIRKRYIPAVIIA